MIEAISISSKEVKYPEITIYWIASDKKAVHYGMLEPQQIVTSAMDITSYEDEAEWEKTLLKLGIDVKAEEELEVIASAVEEKENGKH